METICGELRVQVVDGRALLRDSVAALIDDQPGMCVCSRVGKPERAYQEFVRQRIDVSVIDADCGGGDFCRTLEWLRSRRADASVIMLLWPVRDQMIFRGLSNKVNGIICPSDGSESLLDSIRAAAVGRSLHSTSIQARLDAWSERNGRVGNGFAPPPKFTPREFEVMRHVASGRSVKETASVMALSPQTVDNHKARLMKKIGVHTSVELTRYAIREGYVTV